MEIIFKKYSISESEFWRTRFIHSFKVFKLLRKILTILLSLLLVWAGSKELDTLLIFYCFLGINVVFFSALLLRIYFIPYLRYKKNLKAKYDQTIIFSDTGIKFIVENLEMKFKGMETKQNKTEWVLTWEKVYKIFEDKNLYVLSFNRGGTILTIPKRIIENDEDIKLFIKILSQYSKASIQKV